MSSGVKPQPASTIKLPNRPPEECTILVVDDDERILDVFTAILSRDGYIMVGAASGKAALEKVKKHQPDVIVLDVVLPDMTGIEVSKAIKAKYENRFVPIILVTGRSSRDYRLEGLSAGADEFLSKPVEPVELTTRVRTLLRTKQLNDEVEKHRRDLEKRVNERTKELQDAKERLEQLSAVKSRVLSVVAHELRTPLHQAKLAADLSKQEVDNPEQRREMLAKLDESFRMLEYRLNDISLFADPGDLKLSPVAPIDLVTGAVEQMRKLRSNSNDIVNIDIPTGLPPVEVDTNAATRAISHIVHNGVKFSDGKPVSISAKAATSGVKIQISDQGPGISEAIRPDLFQPLKQGDDSATRRHGGMGLGLALVKMIFDAHKISVTFESKEKNGTTVSFTLPAANI